MDMLKPEAYSGSSASFVEYGLAFEEFAAADAARATLMHVHNSGVRHLEGRKAQKQK